MVNSGMIIVLWLLFFWRVRVCVCLKQSISNTVDINYDGDIGDII